MTTSRRRGIRQNPYFLGLITGALGLAATLSLMAVGPSPVNPDRDMPKPQVSVLQRPESDRDKLPAGFENLPVAERLQDLSLARLAVEEAGRRYYVAPSTGNEICLLSTFGEGAQLVSAGTCESLDRVASSGMYLGEADASGRIQVAMIVPDGVTAIRTDRGSAHPARNNVALIPAMTPKTLQFVGGPFDGVVIETQFEGAPEE